MPDNTLKQKNIATFAVDSASYAKYRPTYRLEFFAYLAGLAPARDLAWDAATGNGQAAIGEAALFHKVIANDVSREQLAEAPRHPRIEYRHCAAEAADIPPGSVDLVTVGSALHWLDLDTFFPAAAAALKPGGVFACFGNDVTSAVPAVAETVAAYRRERLSPYQAASSSDFGRKYEKIAFPFTPVAPPDFTRTEEWTLEHFCRHQGTTSAVKRRLKEGGGDAVAELAELLAPVWGEGAQKVVIGLRLWVGLNPPR